MGESSESGHPAIWAIAVAVIFFLVACNPRSGPSENEVSEGAVVLAEAHDQLHEIPAFHTWTNFDGFFAEVYPDDKIHLDQRDMRWRISFEKVGVWWGRYVVRMTLPVEAPYGNDKFQAMDALPLEVKVTGIRRLLVGHDTSTVEFLSPTLELNEEQWIALSMAPFSMAELGLTLITNQPLTNLHEALRVMGVAVPL